MINQGNILQSTTQKYLEIFDITNDLIVMHDGACSVVLRCTAINFDLYSEEEQDATIYAYAALLNSLSFAVEIIIRSQKKDVTSYLDILKDQEVRAYHPVKKKNIREYREFVEQLVQERNVLDKKFYIIIPYSAIESGLTSGSSFIPFLAQKGTPILDKHSIVEKALTNLEPRKEHLIHQFARIGLSAQQLKTQELIQLFYTIYNPESARGAKLVDPNEYVSPLVQSQLRYAPAKTSTSPTTPSTTPPSQPMPETTPLTTAPPPPAINQTSSSSVQTVTEDKAFTTPVPLATVSNQNAVVTTLPTKPTTIPTPPTQNIIELKTTTPVSEYINQPTPPTPPAFISPVQAATNPLPQSSPTITPPSTPLVTPPHLNIASTVYSQSPTPPTTPPQPTSQESVGVQEDIPSLLSDLRPPTPPPRPSSSEAPKPQEG